MAQDFLHHPQVPRLFVQLRSERVAQDEAGQVVDASRVPDFSQTDAQIALGDRAAGVEGGFRPPRPSSWRNTYANS